MYAHNLRPGQFLVLNSGAYYAPTRGLVLGLVKTPWGTHAEIVREQREDDVVSYIRDTVEGRSTELGIGWTLEGN